jgi:hypothetical protein
VHVLLQSGVVNVPVPSQLSDIQVIPLHLYFGFVQVGVFMVIEQILLANPVATSQQFTSAVPKETAVTTPLLTVTLDVPLPHFNVGHVIIFPFLSLHVAVNVVVFPISTVALEGMIIVAKVDVVTGGTTPPPLPLPPPLQGLPAQLVNVPVRSATQICPPPAPTVHL